MELVKLLKDQPEAEVQADNLQATEVTSEFHQLYRAAMNCDIIDPVDAIPLFRKHNIKYCPEKAFSQLAFEIVKVYLMHEILKIRISYASFQFQVTVLNDSQQNPHGTMSNMKGRFGQLFFYVYNGNDIAVKSFAHQNTNFHSIFIKALQEWCILKICSVLQCAPQLEKQMGFDIIVYQDCIQIYMEKCIILKRAAQKWYSHLKQELEIMHCFKIVHADIKPENVAFSPKLGKAVFIDFGLSMIIKEKVGLKTNTFFRGSPKYCCPEMLDLLSISMQTSFIDLYYNDFYGLKQSFQQEQNFISNIINELQDNYQSLLGAAKSEELNKTLERLCFLYRFKYYYISEDLRSISALFLDKELLTIQILPVLRFIRDIFQQIFLAGILEILCDNYSDIAQYKAILKLLNRQKSKIRVHMTSSATDYLSQDKVDFSRRYKEFLLIINSTPLIMGNQTYYQYLIMDSETSQNQQTFDLLLFCLRFNIKNLSFNEKVKIACKWRKILENRDGEHCHGSLDDIKAIFHYFLEHCLKQPFDEWKRKNIIEIIYHAIILGIDINLISTLYRSRIKYDQLNITSQIILFYQLNDLYERLLILDLASDINQSILLFIKQLQNQLFKKQQYFQEVNILKVNPQEKQLLLINQQIYHLKEINSENLISSIKRLKNKELCNSLTYQVLLRKFIAQLELFDNESFPKLKEMINSESFRCSSNLHILIHFCQVAMLKLELFSELNQIVQEIQSIIDCDTIFRRFNLKKNSVLLNCQNQDKQLLLQYLAELDKNYYAVKSLNIGAEKQLYYFFTKFDALKDERQHFTRIMKSLYEQFIAGQSSEQCRKSIRVDYQNTLLKCNINKQFIHIFPEYLCDYEKRLKQMEQQIQPMELALQAKQVQGTNSFFGVSSVEISDYVFLKFQYYYSQYQYCTICRNQKDQLHYLIQLCQILQILDVQSTLDYLQYQTIVLSNILRETKIFTHYLNLYFVVALSQRSPINYLLNSKKNLLFYSLQYFYKTDAIQKIASLLGLINQWLFENPLAPYSSHYFQSISHFYLSHPQFFTFSTIESYFTSTQRLCPYICVLYIFCTEAERDEALQLQALKLVAKQLVHLNATTKNKILTNYKRITIRLKIIGRRKVEAYLLRYCKKWMSEFSASNALRKLKVKGKSRFKSLQRDLLQAKIEKLLC